MPDAAPNQNARGILLMLVAILLFSAMDAVVKLLVGGYPTMQVVWVRFALQFGFVTVLLLWRGDLQVTLRTRFPGLHVIRSICQFATVCFYFFGLRWIGLAEAQALADINPLLITLGAAIFLGERLGPRRIAGVTAAMIGALIIIRPGVGVFTLSALLPLGAAVSYAATALITRRVGRHESPWTSMLYGSAFCTAISSAFALPNWAPVASGDLPLFLLIGILATTAQLFVIRSFTIAEAAVVAPFSYVGILFATGWGILLFNQYPDRWTVIGALVIVGAGLYVWHRETQLARTAAKDMA